MISVIALLLLASPEAPAAEDPDCGGNTLQMVRCANRGFAAAEREMAIIWQGIALDLKANDRESDDHLSPTRLEAAQAAQDAWALYRDAQCAADADFEARGGTVYPLYFIGCRSAMTRERSQQLQSQYQGE